MGQWRSARIVSNKPILTIRPITSPIVWTTSRHYSPSLTLSLCLIVAGMYHPHISMGMQSSPSPHMTMTAGLPPGHPGHPSHHPHSSYGGMGMPPGHPGHPQHPGHPGMMGGPPQSGMMYSPPGPHGGPHGGPPATGKCSCLGDYMQCCLPLVR